MAAVSSDANGGAARAFLLHPSFLAVLGFVLAMLGLAFVGSVAIGPDYWAVSTYLDAAHRIANGQRPDVDFSAPAGPLEYYLFYLTNVLFPDAQPLLSAQWSILIVALPLWLLIAPGLDAKSRRLALCLTIPFLCFALLPVNSAASSVAAGFDGGGTDQRHAALLLYAFVAALLFGDGRLRVQIVIGVALFCLFLLNVFAFATGALLVLYALAVRRLRLADTLLCALAIIAALGAVEAATGMAFAHLRNMLQPGAALPRPDRLVASGYYGLLVPLGLAALCLFAIAFRRKGAATPQGFATDALWLCAIAIAALPFERAAGGGQPLIYLLPALLPPLRKLWHGPERDRLAALAAFAALAVTAVLIFAPVVSRALPALLSQAAAQRLEQPVLGPMGRVGAHPGAFLRAAALNRHYAETRDAHRRLAREGVAHSEGLAAEPAFQLAWLINAAAAARALQAFEANAGRRLQTLYTFDFTDPLPFLLGRRPLRHAPVAADPLPLRDEAMLRAIAGAEGILVPLCPVMPLREAIASRFAAAAEGRQRISLTPCWDLLVRDGSDFAALR